MLPHLRNRVEELVRQLYRMRSLTVEIDQARDRDEGDEHVAGILRMRVSMALTLQGSDLSVVSTRRNVSDARPCWSRPRAMTNAGVMRGKPEKFCRYIGDAAA